MKETVQIQGGRFPSPEEIMFQQMADIMQSQVEMEEYDNSKDRVHGEIQQKVKDRLYAPSSGSPNVVLFKGALHTGKTALAIDVVKETCRKYPGIQGMIGRKTYREMGDSIRAEFIQDLQESNIPFKENKKEDWVLFPNRSRVLFRSSDMAAKLGGLPLSFAVFEEANELAELYFDTALGRIGRQGDGYPWWCLLMTNPPNKGHWLFKRFEKERTEGFFVFSASIDDVPYVSERYKETIKRQYAHSPSLYKRYVLGEWGSDIYGDPVYHGTFNKETHVSGEGLKPEYDFPIIRSWDFGYHRPALLFSQRLPGNRLNVLREFMPEKIQIERFLELGLERSLDWFADFDFVDCCDSQGVMKSDLSEKTRLDIMKNPPFNLSPKFKKATYEYRIGKVVAMLNRMVSGKPALQIDGRYCPILIEGMEDGYVWAKEPKNEAEKRHPAADSYYEHCLSGSSLVRTLNGWKPIKELVGQEFYTYAYSEEHKRLIPAKATGVRKTRENAEVWKLTYDNGEIIATPDHLIMMRDGSYRALRDLKGGDSLMPLYENVKTTGHTSIELNDGSFTYEHHYIWHWFGGFDNKGSIIHHIDGNGRNNNPENLMLLSKKEHEITRINSLRKNVKEFVKNSPGKSLNPWTQESRDKVGKSMRAFIDASRIEKICEGCGEKYQGTPKQMYCSQSCLWRMTSRKRRGKATSFHNHKVISITPFGFEDVYNLEVEKYHNFPANGIMVHNCQDCLQFTVINYLETGAPTTRESPFQGKEITPSYRFR